MPVGKISWDLYRHLMEDPTKEQKKKKKGTREVADVQSARDYRARAYKRIL
jgi:hypothetical protein